MILKARMAGAETSRGVGVPNEPKVISMVFAVLDSEQESSA
jgi:hypothetical protein